MRAKGTEYCILLFNMFLSFFPAHVLRLFQGAAPLLVQEVRQMDMVISGMIGEALEENDGAVEA